MSLRLMGELEPEQLPKYGASKMWVIMRMGANDKHGKRRKTAERWALRCDICRHIAPFLKQSNMSQLSALSRILSYSSNSSGSIFFACGRRRASFDNGRHRQRQRLRDGGKMRQLAKNDGASNSRPSVGHGQRPRLNGAQRRCQWTVCRSFDAGFF
jgi:hypothetical protein